MKFSGKPLPNTCEAPEGREACVGYNLSLILALASLLCMLNFSLQSVKWGNKTTLRACSRAQMKSCAMLAQKGLNNT